MHPNTSLRGAMLFLLGCRAQWICSVSIGVSGVLPSKSLKNAVTMVSRASGASDLGSPQILMVCLRPLLSWSSMCINITRNCCECVEGVENVLLSVLKCICSVDCALPTLLVISFVSALRSTITTVKAALMSEALACGSDTRGRSRSRSEDLEPIAPDILRPELLADYVGEEALLNTQLEKEV